LGPPSIQSPFAACRRYRHAGDVQRLLIGSYSHFIAPTGSCAKPLPSCRLWHSLLRQVFAGCCQPLLRNGPSRRYLCQSFPACLDPYSGCSQGARARFFPLGHWPSPNLNRVGASLVPKATFIGGSLTELQSFANVQTHKFARHTDSSHLRVLRHLAAVAFTSAPITVRCLPIQRICLSPKSGQLTIRGLAPLKIGSLVGCSSDPRSPGSRARSVHTCQVLRPRRVGRALALSRPSMLPSANGTASAPGIRTYRGSMAGLCVPLSTLRAAPRGAPRMTRGQHDSLRLCCQGLAPLTPCRFHGALHLSTAPAPRRFSRSMRQTCFASEL